MRGERGEGGGGGGGGKGMRGVGAVPGRQAGTARARPCSSPPCLPPSPLTSSRPYTSTKWALAGGRPSLRAKAVNTSGLASRGTQCCCFLEGEGEGRPGAGPGAAASSADMMACVGGWEAEGRARGAGAREKKKDNGPRRERGRVLLPPAPTLPGRRGLTHPARGQERGTPPTPRARSTRAPDPLRLSEASSTPLALLRRRETPARPCRRPLDIQGRQGSPVFFSALWCGPALHPTKVRQACTGGHVRATVSPTPSHGGRGGPHTHPPLPGGRRKIGATFFFSGGAAPYLARITGFTGGGGA